MATLRGLPGGLERGDELTEATPRPAWSRSPRAAATSTSATQCSAAIKLDRFISASVVYPTDYGYVPDTLAPDGDPLDVLVCVSEPTFPGCIVPAKVIGLFKMADEKGDDDHVAVRAAQRSGLERRCEDLDDLPRQLRAEIGHFFEVYKDLDPGPALRGQGVGRSRRGASDDRRGAGAVRAGRRRPTLVSRRSTPVNPGVPSASTPIPASRSCLRGRARPGPIPR